MQARFHLGRWLAAAITTAALAVALAVSFRNRGSAEVRAAPRAERPTDRHNWPLFGGSLQRNMVNLFERNVPTEWDTTPGAEKNIKWSVGLGSRSYGGPVIADGRIYIGTNRAAKRTPAIAGDKGVLRCYREADGKFLWQAVHHKLPAGLRSDWPDQGICSTPMVEGNRLYYVSNRCELICASTEALRQGKNEGVQDEQYKGSKEGTDADIVWRLDMIKELGVYPHSQSTSCPLVVGNLVFVVTSNGVDEGHIAVVAPKAPSFIAVDKKTGKVIWQDNSPSGRIVEKEKKSGRKLTLQALEAMNDRGEKILHGQWSNPVYAVVNGKPQIIFSGGDGWLRAFEPNAAKRHWRLVWKFDCNPKKAVYRLHGNKNARNGVMVTPVVHENKLYVGVGDDPENKYGMGHFWCVDITKTGDLSPELVVKYDPAKVNRDLKKGPLHNGAVTRKNPNSGVIWHFGGPGKIEGRNYLFGRTISTCAVNEGLIYIAELEGIVHCLDARTGKEYWNHNLGAETWCSPYWVDNKVYIGNDEGQVYIFKHGKNKKEPKVIEMDQGQIRVPPVAVNGVLYIMTVRKLFAIKK